MQLYHLLSKIGFLKKSYAFKFLFISFLGTHIPLIGIILFVIFHGNTLSASTIIIFTLLLTLLATAITLYFLKGLMHPIELVSKALHGYQQSRKIPNLPLHYSDEAGFLMKNFQLAIEANETNLKDKQDLIYLLSHDMKNYADNPGYLAQLILEEEPAEAIVEYSQLILESTQQQKHFLQTFITLLRQEEELAEAPMADHDADIRAILDRLQQQVKTKIKNKKLKFTITMPADVVHFKINEDMLLRVLVNLVDNAIKFSYVSGAIDVVVSKDTITVRDYGTGFVLAEKEAIFRKFTVVGRSGTRNEASTGIGLYLCRKIIEKYQGKLMGDSEGKEKGAKFTILF